MEFDSFEEWGAPADELFSPVAPSDAVRIFGIHFDGWLSLDQHFAMLAHRTQMHQGVLARLARTSLVLEIGVLRIIHSAIVASFQR